MATTATPFSDFVSSQAQAPATPFSDFVRESALPNPEEATAVAGLKAQQAADITSAQAGQMLAAAGQRMLQGAIPPGLQPEEQDPLLDKRPLPALNPNLQSIVSGVEQMAEPALQEKAGGAHQILSGAMGIGAGALPIAVAAAPVATAVGLGTGALAQTGTEAGLKKAGVPEDYANLAGDVAGLVAGGAAGHAKGLFTDFLKGKTVAEELPAQPAETAPPRTESTAATQTLEAQPEPAAPMPFEEFLRGKEARNVQAQPAPAEPKQIAAAPEPEPAPQQSPFEASGGKIISFEPHKGADIPGDFLTVAAHPQGPGADEGMRQIHEFNPQGSTRWPPDLEAKLAEHGLTPENIVGYSRVRPDVNDPSQLSAIATHVAEDFRRQGAATGMYDAAEAAQAGRIAGPARMNRSEVLSPDAQQLWEARHPARGTSILGSPTRVPVPGEGTVYPGKYALRDLADVQPSHSGISFEPNPAFEHTNERNYSKAENAERVVRQAGAFDPSYLLTDNPDAGNGPPIIDARGNVLGGNSRAMTLQRIYESRPESALAYKDLLEAKAPAFGIDREQVRMMKRPVLVREADQIDNPQQAITDFNKTGTAALSPAERAVSDSRRVSSDTLDYLASKVAEEGESGTLATAMSGKNGPEIINRLVEDKLLTPQEKHSYIDERGVVTPEAKQRVSRLMVGRMFDTPAAFENAPVELRNKLERIVAPLSRVQADDQWDLTPHVKDAVSIVTEARQRGIKNLDDLRSQSSMFGGGTEHTPEGFAIARKLQDSPLKAAKAFQEYAQEADFAKGGGLFETPTPDSAFTHSFGDRQQPAAPQEAFVEGSGLGALGSKIFDRFGSAEGAPENYSGLGARKDFFLRNLSQLEKADPEAHAAAVRAASSRAQSSALINVAAPQIDKALGRDGPSSTDFRRTLIESRLQGIQQRWEALADEAQKVPNDKLAQWVTRGPLQILGKMSDQNGFDTNPAETAAALAEKGDMLGLRNFVARTFRQAGAATSHVMTPEEFQRSLNSPGFQRALPVYKKLLEEPLAENHALNEGVFSDALGPAKTYYPLVPVAAADQARATVGKVTAYRKPANKQNEFATGLAPGYDAGMDTLKNRLTGAFKANDRAALVQTLQDGGLMHVLGESERAPSTFMYKGQEFPAATVETRGGYQRVKNGQLEYQPAVAAVVPKWLKSELDPILKPGETKPPGLLAGIIHAINQFALAGPADAVFHSHNLLGTLVANTPFVGRDLASKTIGNTPFTKIFTSIAQLALADPMGKEAAVDLRDMAKLGILPERFGSETFSEKFAEQTGAKHVKYSFGPLLYGPKGIDVRARLVMYRTAKELNPKASPSELHMFVNQLGNYTTALQGSLERAVKSTGLSPFYTAGSTMLRNGINAWLGTGPTAGSGPAARIAQQLSGGAVGVVAAWAATYKAYTGKWPWDDQRAKFMKIPLNPAERNSDLARAVYGKDTRKVGYVNFGFASPLVGRGARALGISGGFNTAVEGGSPAQIAQGAKADIVNTAAQPFFGPPARIGLVAATGKQPYLVRDTDAGGLKPLPAIDKKAPIGSEALTALKQLNSFYGNVGAATGMGSGANDHGQSVQDQLLKAVLDMAGVLGGSSNPYKATQSLRQERRRHR